MSVAVVPEQAARTLLEVPASRSMQQNGHVQPECRVRGDHNSNRLEPWGRYATGVAELFAATLLLFPRTVWLGAVIAAGVMLGAIGSHLTKLGIVVKNDGGLLFTLAIIVFAAALVTLFIHRRQLPFAEKVFAPNHP